MARGKAQPISAPKCTGNIPLNGINELKLHNFKKKVLLSCFFKLFNFSKNSIMNEILSNIIFFWMFG